MDSTRLRRLTTGMSRNVYVVGAVSLFTDMASEMIAPLRIVFLVSVLGISVPVAGLFEGLAESTASLLKIVSGRLADRVQHRKPLIVVGYTLSNIAKPLLALATTWPHVLAIMLVDRIGKGIRGSPRDALLADATPPGYRGKVFGFHRAMDTFGAALGPAFALLLLTRSPQDLHQVPPFFERLIAWHGLSQLLEDLHDTDRALRHVFGWTALPGTVAILVVIFFLRESPRGLAAHVHAPTSPLARVSTHALGAPFWFSTGVATLFALGNASDAFFFLRAVTLDAWLEALPAMYLGYNLIYAVLATPLGVLSDRWGRIPVLIGGFLAFAIVYGGWAVATSGWQTWLLFLIYGVYAAATEGVAKALVVDLVPRTQRGTALGWFNGLTGVAALPANMLAGWVWVTYGPSATFTLSALLATAAAFLLLAWYRGFLPVVAPRSFHAA